MFLISSNNSWFENIDMKGWYDLLGGQMIFKPVIQIIEPVYTPSSISLVLPVYQLLYVKAVEF